MAKHVQIPKVGVVAFPDDMADQDIAKVAGEAHHKAVVNGLLDFISKDPNFQNMKPADAHKALAEVATFLDKYPRIARAADAGVPSLTSQPSEPTSGTPATVGIPSETGTPQSPAVPQVQPE